MDRVTIAGWRRSAASWLATIPEGHGASRRPERFGDRLGHQRRSDGRQRSTPEPGESSKLASSFLARLRAFPSVIRRPIAKRLDITLDLLGAHWDGIAQ